MDTDAIMINKCMDKVYIDDAIIGKFKLVTEITEFVALATKFYI